MEDTFTAAEHRLAKAIGKTLTEARELLKASQKKREEEASLDFTKPKVEPKKTNPP